MLARWLRSDALLASLEGPAVACGSADSLRAFRRHVSDGSPHVVPDACGLVTATEAKREPERQRECPDDPHEEEVYEGRRHAELLGRRNHAEAEGRHGGEQAEGSRIRHRRLKRGGHEILGERREPRERREYQGR